MKSLKVSLYVSYDETRNVKICKEICGDINDMVLTDNISKLMKETINSLNKPNKTQYYGQN